MDSAWRSIEGSEDSWEEIDWEPAVPGYVLLKLDHFCDVFAGAAKNKQFFLTSRLHYSAEDAGPTTVKVMFGQKDCSHCSKIISESIPANYRSLEAGGSQAFLG